MTSSTIKLENIWKTWKIGDGEVFTALKGVDLEIFRGEYSAIVGPSGSGKSTLMHMIGLLDRPTQGKVTIEGREVSRLDDNSISKLRSEFVGFVFQQFNLLNKLTIRENILLPITYTRKRLEFDPNERADYLMDRFGILSKSDSFPNKISGGQQQRVAVARALIMNPKLILADEPTGNLDTKSGEEIMKLFEELNRTDDITVILVTHEPEIADRTRRQIRVRDGEIISDKRK